jgi:cellulose biosynthesis protein BcsQ
VLVDADPNRSSIAGLGAIEYSEKVPLRVVDEFEALAVKDCDQFIVDTKARPSMDDLQSIVRSSTLIIVPTATITDEIRVTLDTIKLLQKAGANQYRVLLTKAPTSFNSARIQEARDLLEQFNVPTFQSVIRSYIAYNDAFSQRIPVCNLKGGSSGKAWTDYKDLAKEVLEYVN